MVKTNVIDELLLSYLRKRMSKHDEVFYQKKQEVYDVLEENNILYDNAHAMDFYRPIHQVEHDITIIDIHGGAWFYGDKRINRHFCMHLAKEGFPIFNMNYDLVPSVDVKTQVQQIISCIRYILEHSEEYGIQGNRLCLSGDSAGAHLATIVAGMTRNEKVAATYGIDVKGIQVDALLLQHGIYNLSLLSESKIYWMRKLYKLMYPEEERRGMDSLVKFIDDSWDIPMFLLSGKNDTSFSYQTTTIMDTIEKYQCPHRLLFWDNDDTKLNHVFHLLLPDLEESQTSIKKMAEFLKAI